MPTYTQTLLDNFDDNVLDGTKWLWDARTTETGGRIRITTLLGGGYSSLYSLTNVDFSGRYYGAQLVTSGNLALAAIDVYPARLDVGANSAYWELYNPDKLECYTNVAGVVKRGTTLVYSSATHKFFAVGASGGSLGFLWSTDGVAWTMHTSLANPLGATTGQFLMTAGTNAAEASTTFSEFDDASYWTPSIDRAPELRQPYTARRRAANW